MASNACHEGSLLGRGILAFQLEFACCLVYAGARIRGTGENVHFLKHVNYHVRCWVGVGGVGGDVNVPCTCTHVGCYARCWVGVGGMLTFLALAHMLDATQDAGLGWEDVNGPCTCTHVGCYADSLLKFKRALNAGATLFVWCF